MFFIRFLSKSHRQLIFSGIFGAMRQFFHHWILLTSLRNFSRVLLHFQWVWEFLVEWLIFYGELRCQNNGAKKNIPISTGEKYFATFCETFFFLTTFMTHDQNEVIWLDMNDSISCQFPKGLLEHMARQRTNTQGYKPIYIDSGMVMEHYRHLGDRPPFWIATKMNIEIVRNSWCTSCLCLSEFCDDQI